MPDRTEGCRTDFALSDAEAEDVRLSMQEVRDGKVATKEELDDLWKKFGL
jgi:hypothetical protein